MKSTQDPKERSGAESAKKPAAPKKTSPPNTTLPRAAKPSEKKPHADEKEAPKSEPKPRPTTPRQPKKTAHRVHTAPVPQPQDEALDEVLDEAADTVELTVEEPEELPEETVHESGSIFQRMRARRERQADQKLSTLELIRKKAGLSEDDVALIIELGYEAELGRLVGYENVKKLKYDHLRRTDTEATNRYHTAFGYCGEEAIGSHGKQRILAAYHADRRVLLLRVLLTALATVCLFFLELPALLGSAFVAFHEQYATAAAVLSALLLLGEMLLAYRHLWSGLRHFLHFHPTPFSAPAVILPFVLGYAIYTAIRGGALFPACFLSSWLLLLPAIYDVFRLSSELRAYRIFTAEGQKQVLEPVAPRKKKLRRGEKLVKVINDDIDESFYRVNRAEQLTGFFRRFYSSENARLPFQFFTYMSVTLPLLVLFAVWIGTASLEAALSSWMQALLVSAPITAVFSYFIPLLRANRILAHYNCVLLGEEAVAEYNTSKTLIFRDTDLFSRDSSTQLSLQSGTDLRRDVRLASLLFAKLGGVLTPDPPPSGASTVPVSLVRVAEEGVEAVVDNRYHLLAGSAEFLKRYGVRVPRESSDKILSRTPDTGLLYLSVDGSLKLAYELRYTEKALFSEMATALAEIGTATAIRTYDPDLNEAFLQLARPEGSTPVRVIKPGRFEADPVLELVDTGAVALGDPYDLVYPVHAAHGVAHARRFGYLLQLFTSLPAALAVLLAGILGASSHITVPAIALFWGISLTASALSALQSINRHTLHIRKTGKK